MDEIERQQVVARAGSRDRFRANIRAVAHDGIRDLLEELYVRPVDVGGGRFRTMRDVGARLAPVLGALDDTARRALFATLFPTVAELVDEAWSNHALRPYQADAFRRPFRAPFTTALLDGRRTDWLLSLLTVLGRYEESITWIASWGVELPDRGYFAYEADLGWLLAAALDRGDDVADDVMDVLDAAMAGEHEVARVGRHVTQALMASRRTDAWERTERLLLAALRQEGLRQAILEAVDESQPGAFPRMLRLIRDEDLGRFSSVVRAFDVWFGFQWDGASKLAVDRGIDRVLPLLEDVDARSNALGDGDPETAYLALWAHAYFDLEQAVPHAVPMLAHEDPEHRFVATHLLVEADHRPLLGHVVPLLRDPDLRVAGRASLAVHRRLRPEHADPGDVVAGLEHLIERVGKETTAEPIRPWPWWRIRLERTVLSAALLENSTGLPLERLAAHVPHLDPLDRERFVRTVAGLPPYRWERTGEDEPDLLEGTAYDLVLECLGDPSPDVRAAAFDALAKTPIRPAELARLTGLLRRKSSDLRRRAILRLLTRDDDGLRDSVHALIAERDRMRRTAGLELLREAVEAGRLLDAAPDLAAAYDRAGIGETETVHLEAIGQATAAPGHEVVDVVSVVPDRTVLRRWPAPEGRPPTLRTAAAASCADSLAATMLPLADAEIVPPGQAGTIRFRDWRPGDLMGWRVTRRDPFPLADVWSEWLDARPASTRDPDGLELVRLWLEPANVRGEQVDALWPRGVGKLRTIVEWCLIERPPAGVARLPLDGFGHRLAELGAEDLPERTPGRGQSDPPRGAPWLGAYNRALRAAETVSQAWRHLRSGWTDADVERWYGLLRRFQHALGHHAPVSDPPLDLVLAAARLGILGDDPAAEIADTLAHAQAEIMTDGLVWNLTAHSVSGLEELPDVARGVDRFRRHVVAVECRRGDMKTPVSGFASTLSWPGGLEAVAPAVVALGKDSFSRTTSWGDGRLERKPLLSSLVRRSRPRPEDTAEAFRAWAEEARVSERRLVELAAYAPQWARFVEAALGWQGLEDAVWWMHAHTKDPSYWDEDELRASWAGEIAERTPLDADDLLEGAVDVEWFSRAQATLGETRWSAVDAAAKFASSSGGHKRAQLFAAAMRGEATVDELSARIDAKRDQNAVRALGLVPLPKTSRARDADVLARYERLQDFARGSRRFGSQRRASETRAVALGMDNLARTAGFRDPLRLQWSMELRATRDLAEGPVVEDFAGGVRLTLSIDGDGTPHLHTEREGKPLRAIPARLRKDDRVVALGDRAKALRHQAKRVHAALETAMVRGDAFEAGELQTLLDSPILAPALSRLVFVRADDGAPARGYPVRGGRALADHAETLHPLRKKDPLRIAHPYDLFADGDWHDWQADCIRKERVQPIKQLFREVYPLTNAERAERLSRRYAGHQVSPRRALALLGQRGWVARPGEGVGKTDHHAGLTAYLTFAETFYTPADIEGLTLEGVVFTNKGGHEPLDLAAVPAVVFSEAMRDLDLVVAVAHQGGVDPEASASTVGMRAALVRETCAMLGLDNVEVAGHHATIQGRLADYAVHLGSASVRQDAGNAVVVVAVQSQHRGRLFLPFADDDPRTAEVLSKVLLFARDDEIRDPAILRQIRRR